MWRGKSVNLLLEDSKSFHGSSFGASRPCIGEIVFNTGMTGYINALTDPSYRGQILVLTYPLIGNYGVPSARLKEMIDRPYESGQIQVQGLVVQNYIENYSHNRASRSLHEWLVSENIPAITGIDTRMLTTHLRKQGTMQACFVPEGVDQQQVQHTQKILNMKHVFDLVTPDKITHYPAGEEQVLLIDIGAKDNILRSLLDRNASVVRAGWQNNIIELAQQSDGIIIGNGPGNPADLTSLINQVKTLIEIYQKPIFGICLGHQILSLAAGAKTYKLKYGHRSVNQPVMDERSKQCYITSQNHGYAVNHDVLDEDWYSWFVNLNDGTNEGIRAQSKPFFSVQFHPEAAPGPQDTVFLFDYFLKTVRTIKQGKSYEL